MALRRVQTTLKLLDDEKWYVGPVSERKAEEILTRLGTLGSFLLRDSLLPEANYVLSVLGAEGHIVHLSIVIGEENSCTVNNYRFDDIPTAITFYCENRIAGVFLQPPAFSLLNNQDIPRQQATIVHSIQLPKPITNTTRALNHSQTPPEALISYQNKFKYSYSSSDESETTIKEKRVTFNESESPDFPPHIHYQDDNNDGPIYTIPHTITPEFCRKLTETENFYDPQTPSNQCYESKAFLAKCHGTKNFSETLASPYDPQKYIINKESISTKKIPPPIPPKPNRKSNSKRTQVFNDYTTNGIPTAILAGIRSLQNEKSSVVITNRRVIPPIPPLRVESVQCSTLKRKSMFNSLESLIEIENEETSTLTRRGSLTSLTSSSPERDTNMEGTFARFKNIFRRI